MPKMTQTLSTCPYSLYSLQFFLLFPLTRLSQQLGLPTLLGYVFAFAAPAVSLDHLIKMLKTSNHVTLVEHSPNHINHQHSSAITLKVILHSVILGIMFTTGMSLIQAPNSEQHLTPIGLYLILLSSFHFGEYFVTSLTNPSTLSTSSFLIDQSSAYVIAISGSFVEYFLEVYFITGFKKFNLISLIGLTVAILGESIRKLAMFTAGRNFSHTISQTKSSQHKLVTHGIYSHCRHPSYAGWFYWAVGSQIMLLNPICVIVFTVISYKFFKERIVYEEKILVDFFGDAYKRYRERVSLWMPIVL